IFGGARVNVGGGSSTINQLTLNTPNAAGSTTSASITSTAAGSILNVNGPFVVNAAQVQTTILGNVQFTGARNLIVPSFSTTGVDLSLNGIVGAGGGSLTKLGSGVLQLNGTVANTLNGTITLNEGTLVLANQALPALASTAFNVGIGAAPATLRTTT